MKQQSPNPRLQRTRSAPLRSPLNRQPLGVGREALQRWPAARPVQVHEYVAGQQGTANRPEAQISALRSAVAKAAFLPIVPENLPPPNPRLQRTRLRSPLSRKPFGGKVDHAP